MGKIADIKKSIRRIKNRYGLAALITGVVVLGDVINLIPKDDGNQDKKEIVDRKKLMSYQEKIDAILMPVLIMIEGCTHKAHQDDIGIWTYGIGCIRTLAGIAVKQGDTLKDNQEAYDLARDNIQKNDHVFKYIKRNLKPEQRGALQSFMYNCGPGVLFKNGKLTELGQAVNDGNDNFVIKEMLKYNKAGGMFMRGLFFRRVLEAYIYQGFITMEELQECHIGGLGLVSCNKEMNGIFNIQLSKNNKRKISGVYDDSFITDRTTAKKFIGICQQEIKGPISAKLKDFNTGKSVCEFLPEQLLAINAESLNMQQTAGISMSLVKMYKDVKNKIERN